MDFTAIKYSGQGSFNVTKEAIDKLIFTENHRHLPMASVNDPLVIKISILIMNINFHIIEATYNLYQAIGCSDTNI